MSFNLRIASFLKELDFHARRVALPPGPRGAAQAPKYTAPSAPALGRNIALIFERRRPAPGRVRGRRPRPRRTRHLPGPGSTQLGHKESVQDTARVLGASTTASSTAASPRRTSTPCALLARAGVERASATSGNPTQTLCDVAHHARAHGQARQRDPVRVPGRRAQQHGNSLLVTCAMMGHGRAHGGADRPVEP